MNTRLISEEALSHFENMIYLPMLVTILTRDMEAIEISSIKLKNPYLNMINNSLQHVQKDLRHTHEYLRRNKMRLEKGKVDSTFTEYLLFHHGYEDSRRYLNVRLRNRSEELLTVYLSRNSV
jgi:hypothetical protein